jgi:uncharacterized protein YodC (DUF2158 family)
LYYSNSVNQIELNVIVVDEDGMMKTKWFEGKRIHHKKKEIKNI